MKLDVAPLPISQVTAQHSFIVPYHKRTRRTKPTIKQIKAIQYINQGMSKAAAMRKAGYSPKSAAKPSQKLMNKDGVKSILESMNGKLLDAGLSSDYMAFKMKEWIDAKKISKGGREISDYDTQIKAYDRWEKQMGLLSSAVLKSHPGQLRRKMTVTEFILDGEKNSED